MLQRCREVQFLIACADVGVVGFTVEPFSDAGLPYRILKYARLGRRTGSPPLAGARTWARAVDEADGPAAFAAALRAQASRRTAPDLELRAWALPQTAAAQDEPLWRRLEELGVARRHNAPVDATGSSASGSGLRDARDADLARVAFRWPTFGIQGALARVGWVKPGLGGVGEALWRARDRVDVRWAVGLPRPAQTSQAAGQDARYLAVAEP